MHSSRAACVFGEARLISSTSRMLANTGPGRNSNSFERWLKTLTPVTSEGSRSGVNWRRENEQSTERASALARVVFHAREVLDDQVPLREQAEDCEVERLVRGVDDAAEVGPDLPGERRPGGRRTSCLASTACSSIYTPLRRASTSSRIATAHSSLLRLLTTRSPAGVMRTTSFQSESNPMSERDTSL